MARSSARNTQRRQGRHEELAVVPRPDQRGHDPGELVGEAAHHARRSSAPGARAADAYMVAPASTMCAKKPRFIAVSIGSTQRSHAVG